MSVLSYIHQLFNADQCHACIHTLRWKDHHSSVPGARVKDIDPWGKYHYRPGCKRYWCNGCKRTFNDLTKTLLHQSKRSLPHWILATFLLCLACSSRGIAREVGVHIRTSSRWCWWLRNAALSYEMQRQLEGTVEADELYHTAGNKGQAHHGGKKALGRQARGRRKKREPGRGHYDKDRPAIIAWISRQGAVVIHATRDFTVKTVQTVLTEALTLADTTGQRWYEAELHRLKGELVLQRSLDNQAEAETCFHHAMTIACAQQAKSFELRAATSLAKLWQQQGKRQEAHDLLAPVYHWFTEGFDTADLKDAKALLEALA